MNWKKVIICIVIIVLVFGVYAIYDNYCFGQELYMGTLRLRQTCETLAGGIQVMQEYFQKMDIDPLDVSRDAFDSILEGTRMRFLYEDAALLYDVRMQYIQQIQGIQREIGSDRRNTCIARFFADKEKTAEITAIKEQLELVTETFSDFDKRYREMSVWEQCFTSWRNQQKMLSEKLTISE